MLDPHCSAAYGHCPERSPCAARPASCQLRACECQCSACSDAASADLDRPSNMLAPAACHRMPQTRLAGCHADVIRWDAAGAETGPPCLPVLPVKRQRSVPHTSRHQRAVKRQRALERPESLPADDRCVCCCCSAGPCWSLCELSTTGCAGCSLATPDTWASTTSCSASWATCRARRT